MSHRAQGFRLATAVCLFLAASALLMGCQDLLNALSDSAAPTGVSASDGDYADSIFVSWGTPSLSSDKWAGYTITGYDLSWDGPSGHGSHFVLGSGTSYSIPVATSDQAKSYSVTVQTNFSGGSASGGSASDTGFALPPTQDLLWYDGGKVYSLASDQWYVTMLQKGFTYNFNFASGGGNVEFYRYKTLDSVGGPVAASPSVASWTCDDGGKANKFYVHVVTSSPSYTASYGF